MPRRFFVEIPITDKTVSISGAEAKHIAKANRLNMGDDIMLFDGSDREFEAKIIELGKNRITAAVQQVHDISRELGINLTLAVALPKGDRQKVLVEKLVELGVSNLIPLNCQRSVTIATEKSAGRLGRWVIESSKQCGRNRLMNIAAPMAFNKLVDSLPDGARLIAHPGGSEMKFVWSNLQNAGQYAGQARLTIAIGPEGGFTIDELEYARSAGWTQICLAPTILRVETAAVAAAAIFGRLPLSSSEFNPEAEDWN